MSDESVVIKQEENEEVFENYGVFQDDYEFKFVQEGTDKTTLMLPTVTYDSMDVKYFNIEIEVENLLNVENIVVEKTDNNTVKYCFKIAKHSLVHDVKVDGKGIVQPAGERNQLREKKVSEDIDVHNYSKSKVVTNPPAESDNQVVKVLQIIGEDGKSETVCVKTKEEALDGTELIDDQDHTDDLIDDEEYHMQIGEGDDGDDDDDLVDMDIPKHTSASRKNKQVRSAPGKDKKTTRKYQRTNHYSKKESEQFTIETNEAGQY